MKKEKKFIEPKMSGEDLQIYWNNRYKKDRTYPSTTFLSIEIGAAKKK